MSWQDIVVAIGQVIFIAALIPSIKSPNKPAFSSSLITAVVLFLYTFVFLTLNLWLSVVGSFALAICWSVLAFQTYKGKNKRG